MIVERGVFMKNKDLTVDYCRAKYSDKAFQHCEMVAFYAVTNPCVREQVDKDIIFKMAMCHDLLEDTDATISEICSVTGLKKSFVEDILGLLTKEQHEDYQDYIKRLRGASNPYAYIVKLADMKDHLLRTETLTDKLRAKYWSAIPELL